MTAKDLVVCEKIAAQLMLPVEAVQTIAVGLLSDGIKITAKNVMREAL